MKYYHLADLKNFHERDFEKSTSLEMHGDLKRVQRVHALCMAKRFFVNMEIITCTRTGVLSAN